MSTNQLKPLPFNTTTIPSSYLKEIILEDQDITQEEIDHLADVCRRYELFQKQEDRRIQSIREKTFFLEKARKFVNYDKAHCALCGVAFVAFFKPKSMCRNCQQYICRNCVQKNADSNGILCKVCFNECSFKARTGLWFTEKLQVAKKDGRIIVMAPITVLRASIVRKLKEPSASSSVRNSQPASQKQNGSLSDPVQEAALRLAREKDEGFKVSPENSQLPGIEEDKCQMTTDSSTGSSIPLLTNNNPLVTEPSRRLSCTSSPEEKFDHELKEALPPQADGSQMDPGLLPQSSMRLGVSNSMQVPELRHRQSLTSSSTRSKVQTLLPCPPSPVKVAEQPDSNLISLGSNELPKTPPFSSSRQRNTSASIADVTNWDTRSMVSRGSVGSATSIYSEREESFTHGIIITGDLKFSIDYDEKNSLLRVFVIKARNVAVADTKTNSSSTYVKTYLLPDKTKQSKRKTKVKKHTNNPVFNEELTYNIAKEDLSDRTLQLAVWHHRHMKANLFLGEVFVSLVDCRFGSVQIWKALQDKHSVNGQSDRKLTKGQIRLALKFLPSSSGDVGELHVYIKNATGLCAPTDALGQSDEKTAINPFVKMQFLPERPRSSKRKTKVVKKTNNPIWEETIIYKGIVKTQLPSIGLELIVWNANKLGRYDYLGGCNLNTGSRSDFGMDATGTERAVWVEMMSKPNTMVEGSVQLRSIME